MVVASVEPFRQLLCGSYRIIYEIETENEVTLLTVYHQSKLLQNARL